MPYQPLVDLRTRRITAVEALLRWHHPMRKRIAPLDFVPLAEESGLIVAIGGWVLETAVQQVLDWETDRPDDAPLSVSGNVSAAPDEIAALLAAQPDRPMGHRARLRG